MRSAAVDRDSDAARAEHSTHSHGVQRREYARCRVVHHWRPGRPGRAASRGGKPPGRRIASARIAAVAGWSSRSRKPRVSTRLPDGGRGARKAGRCAPPAAFRAPRRTALSYHPPLRPLSGLLSHKGDKASAAPHDLSCAGRPPARPTHLLAYFPLAHWPARPLATDTSRTTGRSAPVAPHGVPACRHATDCGPRPGSARTPSSAPASSAR